ncbi:MAG: hypothetical protein R3F43_06095 [bacterium]
MKRSLIAALIALPGFASALPAVSGGADRGDATVSGAVKMTSTGQVEGA